jgi:DNA-binding NarL/FixJ family response regulator
MSADAQPAATWLADLVGIGSRPGRQVSGRRTALLVRADAGCGKTELLEHAVRSASDVVVLRARGVESEVELAFAALHQLCAPVLGQLDRLPGPQRDALAITFGLDAGPAPDRFLVSLATLNLLSEAAQDQPLLCVIDDAQWLDRASAQVLAFVARRLRTESAGMLFAARAPTPELAGLPELVVEGLDDADARELLASVIPKRLDERVAFGELTPQEAQIAQLARDGLSNTAIGARLFISQHTVAYHLRKVFVKLDITSRHQLRVALPAGARSPDSSVAGSPRRPAA